MLRNIAEENGYNLANLEKDAGLPKNSIYKYNKGDIKPNVETCIKIANTLKIAWQTVISVFYTKQCNENAEIVLMKKLPDFKNRVSGDTNNEK